MRYFVIVKKGVVKQLLLNKGHITMYLYPYCSCYIKRLKRMNNANNLILKLHVITLYHEQVIKLLQFISINLTL